MDAHFCNVLPVKHLMFNLFFENSAVIFIDRRKTSLLLCHHNMFSVSRSNDLLVTSEGARSLLWLVRYKWGEQDLCSDWWECDSMRVQCSTCLELLTPGDDLTCTPCGHVFHLACVVQVNISFWLVDTKQFSFLIGSYKAILISDWLSLNNTCFWLVSGLRTRRTVLSVDTQPMREHWERFTWQTLMVRLKR